jgi:hypothetical protein
MSSSCFVSAWNENLGQGVRGRAVTDSGSAYDSEPSAEEERARDWKGRGEKLA